MKNDREYITLNETKAPPSLCTPAPLATPGPKSRWQAWRWALVLVLSIALSPGWAAPQNQPAANSIDSYIKELTDRRFFQDPQDPAKRMYLPRYRLAEQTVSGDRQYQVRFFKQGTGWDLEVYLEKYPAPELGDAVRTAQEFPHQVDVLVRHKPQPKEQNNQAQKELTFQEVTRERNGVKAVLHLEDLGARDAVVQALADPKLEATLLARRTLTVWYLPSREISEVEDQIQRIRYEMDKARPHVLEWQKLDERMEKARYRGDTAEFNRLLKEWDQFKYTQARHILETWGPRELSRLEPELQNLRKGISAKVTLDDSVPSSFDRAVHSYVFAGITANPGAKRQLVRRQLPWQGRYSSYFRPADQTDLWYYLPDRFVLAEDRQIPRLSVKLTGPLGAQIVELEYVAVPWTQTDRLKAAEAELRPTAASKLTFEPLLVDEAQLWVALSGSGSEGSFQQRCGSEGSFQQRSGASVDLRDGLKDKVRLTLGEFQEIYAALFSNSLLLTGEVRLDLGGSTRERIPFEARVTGQSPEALWDKIISKAIFADYQKTIRVKTYSAVFGKEVKTLVVELKEGDTVDLRQDQLEALTKVRLPLREFILNTEQSGQYHYKVTSIRERDGKPDRTEMPSWKAATATILYPEVP